MPESNNSMEASPDCSRRDSTFTYDASPEDMDRLKLTALARSSEHLRTDSEDSGISSPCTTPGAGSVAMKRVRLCEN